MHRMLKIIRKEITMSALWFNFREQKNELVYCQNIDCEDDEFQLLRPEDISPYKWNGLTVCIPCAGDLIYADFVAKC